MPPLVDSRANMFGGLAIDDSCKQDLKSDDSNSGELKAKACQVYLEASHPEQNFEIVRNIGRGFAETYGSYFQTYRVIPSSEEQSYPIFNETEAYQTAFDLNEKSARKFIPIEIETNWFSPDVWTVIPENYFWGGGKE